MNIFARIKNTYGLGYAYVAKACLSVYYLNRPNERYGALRAADLVIRLLRERKDDWHIRGKIQKGFQTIHKQYLRELAIGTFSFDPYDREATVNYVEKQLLKELEN